LQMMTSLLLLQREFRKLAPLATPAA